MGAELNKYGFFNGIFGIEQANWADYWKGVIPDGVVANTGTSVGGHKEFEVYKGSGFGVNVAPGEIMVDNHKGWNMQQRFLECDPADTHDPRIDAVIVRVIYGNDGESKMELDIKKGTPAAEPVAPSLEQATGVVYEYRLANILIPAEALDISASYITDERYVFSMGAGSITPFSETLYYDDDNMPQKECILNVVDGREYRATNTITNEIVVNLPKNPVSTFMCEIDFTSGRATEDETEFEFQGVKFMRNNRTYNVKCTNLITSINARYNILIWWDGVYFWADCKMA